MLVRKVFFSFIFVMLNLFLTKMNLVDLTQELTLLGCRSSFLTEKWVAHHYSMIVWKLGCLVRSMWGTSDMNWLSKGLLFLHLPLFYYLFSH